MLRNRWEVSEQGFANPLSLCVAREWVDTLQKAAPLPVAGELCHTSLHIVHEVLPAPQFLFHVQLDNPLQDVVPMLVRNEKVGRGVFSTGVRCGQRWHGVQARTKTLQQLRPRRAPLTDGLNHLLYSARRFFLPSQVRKAGHEVPQYLLQGFHAFLQDNQIEPAPQQHAHLATVTTREIQEYGLDRLDNAVRVGHRLRIAECSTLFRLGTFARPTLREH
mmetsp:Transcript_13642/g.33572  ORF Transcript_13642/g.33572 Transcript_13642/m.33572 type:complete len:219 (-) Transcript_13642:3345-4001(-)